MIKVYPIKPPFSSLPCGKIAPPGMSTYITSRDDLCALAGWDTSNGDVTRFISKFPWTIWIGLGLLSIWARDIYIQLLSSSYWIFLIITTVLQELTKQDHPHSCNNGSRAMPAWEIVQGFGVMTIMLAHKLIYFRRLTFMDLLRGLVLGVMVPVVMGVSGNYTADQVIIGALVGGLVGLFVVMWIWLVWMERIIVLTAHYDENAPHKRIFGFYGFRDDTPGFYRPPTEASGALVRITAAIFAGESASIEARKESSQT